MTIWICGQLIEGKQWEFQGVFDTENAAKRACKKETFFIAPFELNQEMPEESCLMEDAHFPNQKYSNA